MQFLQSVNKQVSGTIIAAGLLLGFHSLDASKWYASQPVETDSYGIPVEGLTVASNTLSQALTLGQLFEVAGIDKAQIQRLKNRIDLERTLSVGKSYNIYHKKGVTKYLVYDVGTNYYQVIRLGENPAIATGKYEASVQIKAVAGRVSENMYKTVQTLGMERSFVNILSDIFAWEIDFHKLGPDDTFKVIYEEMYRNGEKIGNGKILAASFTHNSETFYAYYYERGGLYGYYDEAGFPIEKSYLQAPLEFSYITSKYSKSRFHPILKEYVPHLGTDYAAPSGTPVKAVGDGIVELAGASSKSGLNVKIKHDSTYATSYLHLSKIARDVTSGARVNQGDVIGYVGSTGLATGPHLCFRFWKNDKQVDPFSEKHSPKNRINEEHQPDFKEKVSKLKDALDDLTIDEDEDKSFYVLNV